MKTYTGSEFVRLNPKQNSRWVVVRGSGWEEDMREGTVFTVQTVLRYRVVTNTPYNADHPERGYWYIEPRWIVKATRRSLGDYVP